MTSRIRTPAAPPKKLRGRPPLGAGARVARLPLRVTAETALRIERIAHRASHPGELVDRPMVAHRALLLGVEILEGLAGAAAWSAPPGEAMAAIVGVPRGMQAIIAEHMAKPEFAGLVAPTFDPGIEAVPVVDIPLWRQCQAPAGSVIAGSPCPRCGAPDAPAPEVVKETLGRARVCHACGLAFDPGEHVPRRWEAREPPTPGRTVELDEEPRDPKRSPWQKPR